MTKKITSQIFNKPKESKTRWFQCTCEMYCRPPREGTVMQCPCGIKWRVSADEKSMERIG